MVVKVNISISEEILKELDKTAREENTSRSAFMAEAVKHFLEEKRQKKEKERRLRAAERIIQIAEEIGPWNATGEVLKWRDRH